VSESSYDRAGEPLKDHDPKGAGSGGDNELDPLGEWMTSDFPISETGLSEELSLDDSAAVFVRPNAIPAAAGPSKRPRGVARSFTSEFIDESIGGPTKDEELFYRYQGGDEKAFFILYERYKTSVYTYCAKVLLSAGLDQSMVEDTYQEVFLRVSQYRNTFRQGEFRAWIFTITRNTCLSWKKRGLKNLISSGHGLDPEFLTEEQALASPSHVQRSQDPLETLTLKEQTGLLLKAIAELPETYREALMLCEYEGLTYDEIGKLTGTSLSTIRIRVFRAKKRLRKVLGPIIGHTPANTLLEGEDDEKT
jgi:RNA polymerase sigma-70 factor, ECF subfamily